MRNETRFLVDVAKRFCSERGLSLDQLSQGWLLRLHGDGRQALVFGYDLGLNGSAAQQIASDKCATFEVLELGGVPAVEHVIFHHPSMAAYIHLTGNWSALADYFVTHGRDIVIKPVAGTGGADVARVRTPVELEDAVQKLFSKGRSLCASPFLDVEHEFRVVVLDGKAEICFRKVRPFVTGNGRSTLAELAAEAADRPLQAGAAAAGGTVPAAGERICLEWRHNLALGSVPELLDADKNAPITALAIAAAEALGLRFCSVDIVGAAVPLVLEVNAGVMMESFARSGPANAAIADRTYRRALAAALGDPD